MESRGNFIHGAWRAVESADGEIVRENPALTSQTTFRTAWSTSSVDEAIESARKAQPAWDRLGFEARRAYLESFADQLASRQDDLARAIAIEAGKPLWEATTEAKALIAKIEIMKSEGYDMIRPVHPEGLENGHYRYRPLGVVAVLGPFNFPLHLPNGHIVPALLAGNTVVVKPSELTPGPMQLYFECAEAAGFPAGVLNLVQGPGPVGARLVESPDVDGVLFTGSYKTGVAIRRATLEQTGKLLALEMGGKNTSVIFDDANLDQTLHEITLASFLTTGQRCSATSRVVCHSSIVDTFVERFAELIDRVTTGDPLTADAFMGPLINKPAFERFLAAQADDEGGKLEPIRRGGAALEDADGYFVRPGLWRAIEWDRSGSHQAEEIFGPDVVVYTFDDEEEAMEIANGTNYGLAMSMFTSDEARFERLSYEARAGIVNMNRSTCGASSRLPFGGLKHSGNHRPSAVTAGLYCTYAQSQLRNAPGWNPDALQSGGLARLSQP